MNTYIPRCAIVVLLLLSSPLVSALAVSDIELHSHLNQTLDARVYLNNAGKDELDSLKIAIRDAAAGGDVSRHLHYQVQESAKGPYISITSTDVIREPVMRFKLELNWSKGHLIREYALIIDPQ